ncbi:MAG: hypothetical protein HXX17_04585 [Geobacteraceae bacterium]|nr:hypothetical protein [Geobacteraceae bacterium]
MTEISLSTYFHDLLPSLSPLLSVLKLFLLPVGGGIPAGVLLAKTEGIPWLVTSLLYLFSDIVLAIAFEPVLRLLALLCGKVSFLTRLAAMMKAATVRSAAHFGATGAGPLALIMIAFGVDPMTGRASALAAGHGFITGWAIAITGDMLYFGVIALTTLQLNAYIQNPNTTMLIVLGLMFILPMIIRRLRSKRLEPQSTP